MSPYPNSMESANVAGVSEALGDLDLSNSCRGAEHTINRLMNGMGLVEPDVTSAVHNQASRLGDLKLDSNTTIETETNSMEVQILINKAKAAFANLSHGTGAVSVFDFDALVRFLGCKSASEIASARAHVANYSLVEGQTLTIKEEKFVAWYILWAQRVPHNSTANLQKKGVPPTTQNGMHTSTQQHTTQSADSSVQQGGAFLFNGVPWNANPSPNPSSMNVPAQQTSGHKHTTTHSVDGSSFAVGSSESAAAGANNTVKSTNTVNNVNSSKEGAGGGAVGGRGRRRANSAKVRKMRGSSREGTNNAHNNTHTSSPESDSMDTQVPASSSGDRDNAGSQYSGTQANSVGDRDAMGGGYGGAGGGYGRDFCFNGQVYNATSSQDARTAVREYPNTYGNGGDDSPVSSENDTSDTHGAHMHGGPPSFEFGNNVSFSVGTKPTLEKKTVVMGMQNRGGIDTSTHANGVGIAYNNVPGTHFQTSNGGVVPPPGPYYRAGYGGVPVPPPAFIFARPRFMFGSPETSRDNSSGDFFAMPAPRGGVSNGGGGLESTHWQSIPAGEFPGTGGNYSGSFPMAARMRADGSTDSNMPTSAGAAGGFQQASGAFPGNFSEGFYPPTRVDGRSPPFTNAHAPAEYVPSMYVVNASPQLHAHVPDNISHDQLPTVFSLGKAPAPTSVSNSGAAIPKRRSRPRPVSNHGGASNGDMADDHHGSAYRDAWLQRSKEEAERRQRECEEQATRKENERLELERCERLRDLTKEFTEKARRSVLVMRYSDAATEYGQAIRAVQGWGGEGGDDIPLLLARAEVWVLSGMYSAADADCSSILAQFTSMAIEYKAAAFLCKGTALTKAGRLEEAADAFKVGSMCAQGRADRNLCVQIKERLEKVAEIVRDVANTKWHMTNKRHGKAIEFANAVLSEAPCHSGVIDAKAVCLRTLGRAEEAITHCSESACLIALSAGGVAVTKVVSEVRRATKLVLARGAVTLNAETCAAILTGNLGEVYYDALKRLGQTGNALLLRKALANNGENWALIAIQLELDVDKDKASGDEHYKKGNYSAAISAYSKALSSGALSTPIAATLYCNRAAARMAIGSYKTAISDCTQALERHPSYTKARLRRARAYRMEKMWSEATTDYDDFITEVDDARSVSDLGGFSDMGAVRKAYAEAKSEVADCKNNKKVEDETRRARAYNSYYEEDGDSDEYAYTWSSRGRGRSGYGSYAPPPRAIVKKQCHYATLGVSRRAPIQEIKKAYRKLALQYHPDKNPNAEAVDKFKEATEAYQIVGNEVERRKYDLTTAMYG